MNFLARISGRIANVSYVQVCHHHKSRKEMLATTVRKEDGSRGEKSVDIDNLISGEGQQGRFSMLPDKNLPNQLFNGIAFKELPICHIRVTKNNTILDVTDAKGNSVFLKSAGTEGFKNARKGTNIAAQTTAMAITEKALERGLNFMRVVVRGLGPGRLSAIKGLQMGGMNVVSITDATRVTYTPRRARKPKRL